MGKKTKIGKQRKDKFYKLAKETGYRSRASFKLIQLNRKFEFLQRSRVLIDLCAAPGGWLQVAQQSMPVSSCIIGVDLVSIKPLPNVICLQEDITTDNCRQALKRQLKTWKADTILHDGAPNVGKSWLHDAFAQAQLTLSALKLATEMLVKGGWFITKVFRSKDYNSLFWLMKKLFKKVHVTKPQASRNESAEIFVVCEGYIAPDRIDPKFLDTAFVFKDVESASISKSKLLQISKHKPKAEGYEDGDASIICKLKASDFIFGDNHLDMLAKSSEIIFDDEDIRNHRTTTEEIIECCKDLKLLGRSELRSLLNWRKNLREAVNAQEKCKSELSSQNNFEDHVAEEKEIEEAFDEAENLELTKLQEQKRKKKKVLKERKKLNERINLKMIIKDDEPIIQEDRELFNISQLKSKKDLLKLEEETANDINSGSEKDDNDDERVHKYKSLQVPYNRHEQQDWENSADIEVGSNSEEDEDEEEELEFVSDEELNENEAVSSLELTEEDKNPLIEDLVDEKTKINDAVSRWFDKDFSDIEDGELEMELLAENIEKKEKKKPEQSKKKPKQQSKSKVVTFYLEKKSKIDADFSDAEIQDESHDISNTVVGDSTDEKQKKKKKKKRVMLDPEGLTLGSLIIQSKKKRRDIIENAYNRYASNDEKLPDWFVKDEEKHYRKQIPVSAEMVAEYKERLKEINARPIKKVIEAKARKKRKALKRLEKAKKRAQAITDNMDMSEKEKTQQLKSIYKKALQKKDVNVTYVVAKKGLGKKARRPAGVKGRYKIVDKRMKKDARKKKMELKKKGKTNVKPKLKKRR